MKRRNLMALVLSGALLAGSLTGCSGGSGTSSATTAAAAGTKALGAATEAAEAAGAETEAAGGSGQTTDWPTGAVTIVVPAGAGGGTDLLARVFAEKLTDKLGQTFVVSNVTGAGGSNGISQVHDAKPDGNTILFFHNAMLINKVTGVSEYSYDGFKPGPHVATDGATGLYISSKAPYKSYSELVEYCTVHPGEVNMGVEVGGYTYMMVKSFEAATGVQFNMIDVGSNAEKCTALLGGHIDIMPNQYSTAKGYIDSGDFIALGFPTEERSEVFPDVPTAKEQGDDWLYHGYEFGFFFPKDTPQEIVDTFNDTVKALYDNNEIQDDIMKLGNEASYMEPAEYESLFADIEAQYTELWSNQ